MDKTSFYELLKQFEISPVSLSQVGVDYTSKVGNQWFHLLATESDFAVLMAEPSIKWYSLCRCHMVVEIDGSTAHEHLHALIRFEGSTVLGYKKRLQRANQKLSSKTNLKKILCLDHAVGVLRYICCADGQKFTRRGPDGLMGAPHTHYCRSVWNMEWLHPRGRNCSDVRDQISSLTGSLLNLEKLGFKSDALHKHETCQCARGAIGMQKREETRLKRQTFYQTEEGKSTKKKYQEKALLKRKLIEEISKMTLTKRACLQRESIVKLLDML